MGQSEAISWHSHKSFRTKYTECPGESDPTTHLFSEISVVVVTMHILNSIPLLSLSMCAYAQHIQVNPAAHVVAARQASVTSTAATTTATLNASKVSSELLAYPSGFRHWSLWIFWLTTQNQCCSSLRQSYQPAVYHYRCDTWHLCALQPSNGDHHGCSRLYTCGAHGPCGQG